MEGLVAMKIFVGFSLVSPRRFHREFHYSFHIFLPSDAVKCGYNIQRLIQISKATDPEWVTLCASSCSHLTELRARSLHFPPVFSNLIKMRIKLHQRKCSSAFIALITRFSVPMISFCNSLQCLAHARARSFFPLVWFMVMTTVVAQQLYAQPEMAPPSAAVPSWVHDAIFYQIFPERFRNGDSRNDPQVNDIRGAWPHEEPAEWNVSSWTGDWYKLQSWELADDKGFYYRAQQRRYGGDLRGILDKLDYLSDLGITAIYINPVFESPSLHKYDAAMYHHIDNNFGPDPEGDRSIWGKENPADPRTWQWTSADRLFLELISEAHTRNIRVIIDGVFNHVGTTFWAFQDVRKNGRDSPYKDWFTIKSWDNLETSEDEFEYVGWAGVKELPELREDENGLADGPRKHVREIVKRWMDPNADGDPADGIDGWRLDVAEMVAIPFWREFRIWVRGINPEAYLVGEVWWEDWKNGKMFNAAPWLQGDVFDAVMNYRWAEQTGHFFKDRKNKITVSAFDRNLATLRRDYRPEATAVLMNLMGSHDTDRLASQIVNPDTRYDGNVNLKDNPDYDVRKPNDEELKIQRLIVLFQMTYLGSPTIYYGDEVGMWGADDPDERKPMLWDDMTYDNETHHPFGRPRPSDRNMFNEDLLSYYKKVIRVRRGSAALSLGDFTTLLAIEGSDVYAYLRSYGTEHVVVILNNSSSAQTISIPLGEKLNQLHWSGLLQGLTVSVEDGMLNMRLAEKSGEILEAVER